MDLARETVRSGLIHPRHRWKRESLVWPIEQNSFTEEPRSAARGVRDFCDGVQDARAHLKKRNSGKKKGDHRSGCRTMVPGALREKPVRNLACRQVATSAARSER